MTIKAATTTRPRKVSQLVKITASPFETHTDSAPKGVKFREDSTWVELQIRLTQDSASPQKGQIVVYKLEMTDEKGVSYNDSTPDFSLVIGSAKYPVKVKNPQDSPVLLGKALGFGLKQSLHTVGRIKLRDKISVDNRCPIPFEVNCPPRPKVAAPKR